MYADGLTRGNQSAMVACEGDVCRVCREQLHILRAKSSERSGVITGRSLWVSTPDVRNGPMPCNAAI